MTATCKDSVELLLEYLDGKLTAELRAKLEAHLGGCSPCEDFWKSYSATPSLCRKALASKMPQEVATKLTDFLRKEMGKAAPLAPASSPSPRGGEGRGEG